MQLEEIKVVLFDTFGTLVDWRGSIASLGQRLATEKGINGVDWDAFARAWRAGYRPGMERVQSGQRPWTPLDVIHSERLDEILPEFGLGSTFTEEEKADINLFWHRLDPWPDSFAGLNRLIRRYLISPLSNGSLFLLVSIARRAGLPWDFILCSDTFKTYKRDDAVYLGAINILGLAPQEIMLAAAHNDDLASARSHGMMTTYVNRSTEYGPDQVRDFEAEEDWDVIAETVEELAEKMGT